MRFRVVCCVMLCLLPLMALATFAGKSGATTRYFYADEQNREYQDDAATRRPTNAQRVGEVTGHWRFLLQVYRVIDRNPELRAAFLRDRPTFQGEGGPDHRELRQSFLAYGITPHGTDRQPTGVYTLQLAAYRDNRSLRRFLQQIFRTDRNAIPLGTRIYGLIPKAFRLEYGDESAAYKSDPVYLVTQRGVTQVRYGIYENPADARRDAAEWTRRYHVRPYITGVSFTPALTDRVLWGDLPGVYEHRAYIRR